MAPTATLGEFGDESPVDRYDVSASTWSTVCDGSPLRTSSSPAGEHISLQAFRASERVLSLPSESFPFGRATSGDPNVRCQLERLVPIEQHRIPYVWATGENHDEFERHLRNHEIVKEVEQLTRVGDSVLYYTDWYEDKETFMNGVAGANGTIMEAHGDSKWSFTFRFRDHADLTRFHQFYQDNDFPVTIDRVYAPDEGSRTEYGFGLTPEQRETLILAVEKGYFSVPRETKLDEIAEALGITRQAASERVRRGAETVLRKALIGLVVENPGSEVDEPGEA